MDAVFSGLKVRALLGGCLLLVACGGRLPDYVLDARKPNTTESQLVKSSPNGAGANRKLVVFVHGILGDAVGSWVRTGDTQGGFVRLLQTFEQTKGKYDILQFGFPTELWKSGSFSVSEAADALHRKLDTLGVLSKYDETYFVAHSMGGLVTLEMLTTHPNWLPKVPAVVTYSTPFGGAKQVVDIARHVMDNKALLNMVGVDDGNDFLKSLGFRWRTARGDAQITPPITCAYETVDFPGLGRPVVTYSQATALCDSIAPIAEDHIGIAKPRSATDASFELLLQVLRADRPGPESMTIDRVADFRGSVCTDGKRRFSEALEDTFVFSRQRKTYTAAATVHAEMKVNLFDQNQGGKELLAQRSCRSKCTQDTYTWEDMIKVTDRVARLSWNWTSNKPQQIEAVSAKGRVPVRSATFTIYFPADVKYREHSVNPSSLNCAVSKLSDSNAIRAECQPKSVGATTSDPISINLSLDVPPCPTANLRPPRK